jgi:phthiodiolone/phenolphthiodiolone dimycocerosates ketoreductase
VTSLPIGIQLLGRPPARLVLGAARLFDLAGAHSLWVIDHWMGLAPLEVWDPSRFPVARMIRNPEEMYDPFALVGTLAQRTRRARLGTAVTEAIRRHPAQLAQAALTLHHVSRGRFILGIGAGERENVEPYGLSYRGQASRLEEALYLIRLLWRSDGYVSYRGRHFTLDRASMGLGPYRGSYPRIWVAAHGPRTLRMAGRYGDGWLPTHHMEPEEYAEHLRTIRAAAEESGRSFRRFVPSYELRVLTAASHAEAHRLLDSPSLRLGALIVPPSVWAEAGARHPLGQDYRGVADWVPSRVDPEEVLKLMDEVPVEVIHTYVDHGTWQQLAARLLSYRAVGLRHAVLANVTPLVQPSRAPASFRDLIRLVRALR